MQELLDSQRSRDIGTRHPLSGQPPLESKGECVVYGFSSLFPRSTTLRGASVKPPGAVTGE